MQYERLLATGRFFLRGRAGKLIDKFRLGSQTFSATWQCA